MKKPLSLVAFCLLAQASQAQTAIKAGTVALGGSINYFHTGTESTGYTGSGTTTASNNTFSFSPEVSYFVKDNLSVGIAAVYGIQEISRQYSNAPANPSYYTNSSLRLGPVVKYYRLLTDQFGLTGALGAGYEHDYVSGSPDTKGNGFYASLVPGIIFLPIPKLGIGASIGGLGYTRITTKPDSGPSSFDTTASTFGANFGLAQLTFSGTYFFGR